VIIFIDGVDCVAAYMMLSFKYATAESSSLFVFREIFISMFCSKMSQNMFQFVLWLNNGESLLFSSSPPCNVINIGEWSEERSRHDFIVRFSHVIFLVMQKSIKSRTLFVSVGQ